jgi:OFA family oxalate/formate antiporter-like MFS transporter
VRASPLVSQRWLIAGALFAVVFSASSPLAAFGVFLPVLAEHFGWSRGAISVALSMALMLGGINAFAVGAIADRHGPRFILAFTVAMAGIGFALASTIGSLSELYLFVGILGGIGTSGFYVIASATVTRWFDRQRSLVLALVLAGFNVSFVTSGPLAAWLIGWLGWRGAFLVFGGWLCLVGGVATLVVRDPPRRQVSAEPVSKIEPRGMTIVAALADRRLWFLEACWLLLGGVVLMISSHIVSYSRDRGVALASASLALTAYGIGATVGRIGFGALADRLGARTVMRICVVLEVAALAVLPFGPPPQVLFLALAVFGMGFSGGDTAFVRIIPDVFGLEALGAITGLLAIGWRSGAAVGPVFAGFVYDATGSYTVPFSLAPVALLLSLALFSWGSASRRSASSA